MTMMDIWTNFKQKEYKMKFIKKEKHYRCRNVTCKQDFGLKRTVNECYACGEHGIVNAQHTITQPYYVNIYSISKWWNPFFWGKTIKKEVVR